MVFNPNIPKPTDLLSTSQGDLLANNAALDASFGINHVPFSTVTNNGKHRFVEMPVLAAIPAPLAGQEGTLYTKTAGTHAQLFYTNGTSTNEYQLTRVVQASFGTFAANPGWSFLPGGLLIQWGTNTTASGSTISFPVAFTNPPFSIQITVFENSTNRHFAYARSSTNTGFVTTQLDSGGSGETNTINWIAIGI